MEFYHNQLKLRLLDEKNPDVYQRTDWLVNKLGTKVHSYFWLDEYSDKDDFARYKKDAWVSGLTSWRKALKFPDSNVIISGKIAKVMDHLDGDKAYMVWNPGSQFGTCNCSWAEMGYLCEHMLKVIKFCRKKEYIIPSISFLQYSQALMNILHCSPFDSMIRDHALSLAVTVQKQLDELIDSESCQISSDPSEKQPANIFKEQPEASSQVDRVKELTNENSNTNKNASSVNDDGCLDGQDDVNSDVHGLFGGNSNEEVAGKSIESESSGNQMIMPKDSSDKHPSEAATQETNSSETHLLNNGPALSKCKLKRIAEDGSCEEELPLAKKSKRDDEPDSQPEVDGCNSTAIEGMAPEISHTFQTSPKSDEQKTDADMKS